MRRRQNKPWRKSEQKGDFQTMLLNTKGKRKALFFTLWFHSLLFWLYVVARIIVSNVRLYALFIDYIPHITFLELGIATFLSSMLFMYLFLKESWKWEYLCAAHKSALGYLGIAVDFVVAAVFGVSVLVFSRWLGCFYLKSRVLNCLLPFSRFLVDDQLYLCVSLTSLLSPHWVV